MPFHSTFMTTLCNGSYYYLSLGKVRSTAINSPGSQMMSLSFIPRESDSRFHDLTTGHILLSSFSPKKMWLLLDVPSMVSIITQCKAQLVAQTVKRLPTMWETWVQSLGREDLLEKEWQPTPVFLPGKSHGWRSLVGYSSWGHKESDTTERLHSLTQGTVEWEAPNSPTKVLVVKSMK